MFGFFALKPNEQKLQKRMPKAWWRWLLVLWLHCRLHCRLHCTGHLYSSWLRIWWFSLRGRSVCSSIGPACIVMKWRILWQRVKLSFAGSQIFLLVWHNDQSRPYRLSLLSCFCSHSSFPQKNKACISENKLENINKYEKKKTNNESYS